jgi:hypothetical protein
MAISFGGASSKPLNVAFNSRAEAYVEVVDSGRTIIGRFNCLLDTGSDYTLLPDWLLRSSGITATGTAKFHSIAALPYTLPLATGVELIVEGTTIRCDVAFYSTGFTPILGRPQAMMAAFDFGFTTSDWYYG